MNAALNEFEIPLVVTPLNMSSPELDELSAITYLSYFIREGSPGYRATLKWVQSQIQDEKINNFNVSFCTILCSILTLILPVSSYIAIIAISKVVNQIYS